MQTSILVSRVSWGMQVTIKTVEAEDTMERLTFQQQQKLNVCIYLFFANNITKKISLNFNVLFNIEQSDYISTTQIKRLPCLMLTNVYL